MVLLQSGYDWLKIKFKLLLRFNHLHIIFILSKHKYYGMFSTIVIINSNIIYLNYILIITIYKFDNLSLII